MLAVCEPPSKLKRLVDDVGLMLREIWNGELIVLCEDRMRA
jgi:hypothetical protein